MKKDVRIRSVEISFVVHSTEDEGRLLETVSRELRLDQRLFESNELEGHYKNPMLKVRAHLTGKKADEFVFRLFSFLSDSDTKTIGEEMDKYIDEHKKLYLRLDKQLLCKGRISLSQTDPIRIKIKSNVKPSDSTTVDFYRGLIGHWS